MSNKLAPLRGMKDLLPEEYDIHKHIIKTAFDTAKLHGYKGLETPILESVNVFDRSLGETSDVVSKEIYSFDDKKGRHIALRPEFTASVMRSFISNGLKNNLPLKLFSSGPLFRYDRPQEGRQRQFNQLNFEYLGAKGPYSDAETLSLACKVLDNLGILQDVTLEINSLGCSDSRTNYQNALKEYFSNHLDILSEDSKNRLEKNPLRILDSKDKNDQSLIPGAPKISDYYTPDSKEYFDNVLKYLDILGVKYAVNEKIVRGLDYYSHTAFEFTTTKLGAQSTVLAGGRYDGLAELMGEKPVPAIGFAAGIERIMLMKKFIINNERPVVVIPIGEAELDKAILLTNNLRDKGKYTLLEINGKIGKRMQTSINNDASHIIFIGTEELTNNQVKLKDLDKEIEEIISEQELFNKIT